MFIIWFASSIIFFLLLVISVLVLIVFLIMRKWRQVRRTLFALLVMLVATLVSIVGAEGGTANPPQQSIAESQPSSIHIKGMGSHTRKQLVAPVHRDMIGQWVSLDSLSYDARSVAVENSIPEGGGSLGQYSANSGVWLVVHLSVKNEGQTPLAANQLSFTLNGYGGTEYQDSAEAEIWSNGTGETWFEETINPGIVQTGAVCFNVPSAKSYAEYVLLIQDPEGKTAKIELDHPQLKGQVM